ncbi:MAG: type II toxin-antitoxin system RelE family toxin [Candidatus Zixiibacteriota bacterium]
MKYSIKILKSAQKKLSKIDEVSQDRIIEAIRGLANQPRPRGCKKLSNRPAWRMSVGNYRVIYEIYDNELRILVIALGHRRDVYRGL